MKKTLALLILFLVLNTMIGFKVINSETHREGPKWTPESRLNLKVGTQRSLGQIGILSPIAQNETSLFFMDMRFMRDTRRDMEGNYGFGYRTLDFISGWISGLYGFFDQRYTRYNHRLNQVTFGGELLSETWDHRLNTYWALTGPKTIHSSTKFTYQGHDRYITQSQEIPLSGFDIEIGRSIPNFEDLRIYGAFYHFQGKSQKDMNGGRLRGSYEINKYVSLNAEVQQDNVRHASSFVGISFKIPLGDVNEKKKLSKLERRMTDEIIRDVDIVTSSQMVSRKIAENLVHLHPQGKITGDGSYENPFPFYSPESSRIIESYLDEHPEARWYVIHDNLYPIEYLRKNSFEGATQIQQQEDEMVSSASVFNKVISKNDVIVPSSSSPQSLTSAQQDVQDNTYAGLEELFSEANDVSIPSLKTTGTQTISEPTVKLRTRNKYTSSRNKYTSSRNKYTSSRKGPKVKFSSSSRSSSQSHPNTSQTQSTAPEFPIDQFLSSELLGNRALRQERDQLMAQINEAEGKKYKEDMEALKQSRDTIPSINPRERFAKIRREYEERRLRDEQKILAASSISSKASDNVSLSSAILQPPSMVISSKQTDSTLPPTSTLGSEDKGTRKEQAERFSNHSLPISLSMPLPQRSKNGLHPHGASSAVLPAAPNVLPSLPTSTHEPENEALRKAEDEARSAEISALLHYHKSKSFDADLARQSEQIQRNYEERRLKDAEKARTRALSFIDTSSENLSAQSLSGTGVSVIEKPASLMPSLGALQLNLSSSSAFQKKEEAHKEQESFLNSNAALLRELPFFGQRSEKQDPQMSTHRTSVSRYAATKSPSLSTSHHSSQRTEVKENEFQKRSFSHQIPRPKLFHDDHLVSTGLPSSLLEEAERERMKRKEARDDQIRADIEKRYLIPALPEQLMRDLQNRSLEPIYTEDHSRDTSGNLSVRTPPSKGRDLPRAQTKDSPIFSGASNKRSSLNPSSSTSSRSAPTTPLRYINGNNKLPDLKPTKDEGKQGKEALSVKPLLVDELENFPFAKFSQADVQVYHLHAPVSPDQLRRLASEKENKDKRYQASGEALSFRPNLFPPLTNTRWSQLDLSQDSFDGTFNEKRLSSKASSPSSPVIHHDIPSEGSAPAVPLSSLSSSESVLIRDFGRQELLHGIKEPEETLGTLVSIELPASYTIHSHPLPQISATRATTLSISVHLNKDANNVAIREKDLSVPKSLDPRPLTPVPASSILGRSESFDDEDKELTLFTEKEDSDYFSGLSGAHFPIGNEPPKVYNRNGRALNAQSLRRTTQEFSSKREEDPSLSFQPISLSENDSRTSLPNRRAVSSLDDQRSLAVPHPSSSEADLSFDLSLKPSAKYFPLENPPVKRRLRSHSSASFMNQWNVERENPPLSPASSRLLAKPSSERPSAGASSINMPLQASASLQISSNISRSSSFRSFSSRIASFPSPSSLAEASITADKQPMAPLFAESSSSHPVSLNVPLIQDSMISSSESSKLPQETSVSKEGLLPHNLSLRSDESIALALLSIPAHRPKDEDNIEATEISIAPHLPQRVEITPNSHKKNSLLRAITSSLKLSKKKSSTGEITSGLEALSPKLGSSSLPSPRKENHGLSTSPSSRNLKKWFSKSPVATTIRDNGKILSGESSISSPISTKHETDHFDLTRQKVVTGLEALSPPIRSISSPASSLSTSVKGLSVSSKKAKSFKGTHGSVSAMIDQTNLFPDFLPPSPTDSSI
ncbi:MAG: inverse autotransporter beta domain-containing protein [Proteobacteria bacterium]|nr:inverse autotransporter beta domain-containing protein [Pseudomonadota bacterium]